MYNYTRYIDTNLTTPRQEHMQSFQTGEKRKLQDLTPSQTLSIRVQVSGPADEYDLILFGLDQSKQLSDDRYMIFYNQPRSPEGALSMKRGARSEKIFEIDLARLPQKIGRLSLAATVDNGAFNAIDHAEVIVSVNGYDLLNYRVTGSDFQYERAVMLFDVYHKDVWRLGAVGQGFSGGLAALVEHFGGEVAPIAEIAQPKPPTPKPKPTSTTQTANSTPATHNQKISLEKQGQSARISLSKSGGHDPVRINLNWDKGGGFLRASTDLDLGCMYVLNDGSRGVIQALGGRFGSDRFSPFIMLDGDDRTGEISSGENLTIFRPDVIHTVLIFAFIYEGTSDFTKVNARLSMQDPRGNEVSLQLSNPDMHRTFCGIALIENYGGEIKITKEERYFTDHSTCDEHYGFGFRWSAGSK